MYLPWRYLAPRLHPFFLSLGPDIVVEFARVVRHDRQVELTFPPKLESRRASGSSRRLRARQDYSVKVLADQFRPAEIRRFVRDHLEPARTRELAERIWMAGLSLRGHGHVFTPVISVSNNVSPVSLM